jgi:hypothetical protein
METVQRDMFSATIHVKIFPGMMLHFHGVPFAKRMHAAIDPQVTVVICSRTKVSPLVILENE